MKYYKAIVLFLFLIPLISHAQSVPPEIQSIINNASTTYNVSTTTLAAVLNCESTFNPEAVGDATTSFGIAQIHLIAHPEITLQEALNPVWAVDYLASSISQGKGRQWTCYRELALAQPPF
jgi:soluble lytic murein transglycosylase-like protein